MKLEMKQVGYVIRRAAAGGGEKGIHGIPRNPALFSSSSPQNQNQKRLGRADMAEEKEKKGSIEKEEEEESPPEKPLPGDCCGSGCVRCVWDVYYEELEDYNNRQRERREKKDDSSKPKSPNSDSSQNN